MIIKHPEFTDTMPKITKRPENLTLFVEKNETVIKYGEGGNKEKKLKKYIFLYIVNADKRKKKSGESFQNSWLSFKRYVTAKIFIWMVVYERLEFIEKQSSRCSASCKIHCALCRDKFLRQSNQLIPVPKSRRYL